MGSKRLRVTAVQVAVQAFIDDGETLTQASLDPVTLTLEQFRTWDIEVALKAVREQLDRDE